tara:strand:- start:496 stop:1059 length:564 start_codon:yes stop_codon:yes gene_type:complete
MPINTIRIDDQEPAEIIIERNAIVDDPSGFITEVEDPTIPPIIPPLQPAIINLTPGTGQSPIKVRLTFDYDLNKSLQIGDLIWHAHTTKSGSYEVASTNNNDFLLLGTVVDISNQYRKSTIDVSYNGFDLPEDLGLELKEAFMMFSKDKAVNSAGLKGYYAELEFVNNSNKKIELFSVGSEVVQSSK